ncbi:MAG TPA: hypothetical protein VFA41_22645 [Ktedonobacteraceae bacterium]|jgi:hypothetical protein|nr:hypothetical protein [Ktedonobacteraceae bacterium]
MQNQKSTMRKTLTAAGIAYAAFTTLSVVVPILLDRLGKRKRS